MAARLLMAVDIMCPSCVAIRDPQAPATSVLLKRMGIVIRCLSGLCVLLFLLGVLVLMVFDRPIGTWTIGTLVIIIPALIGGWYLVRKQVLEVAQERERLGLRG